MKTEEIRVQSGIKRHGEKGNISEMKEIRNLAENNYCFGELNYKFLTEEMKSEALPMLMVMADKINGDINTRCYARSVFQRESNSRKDLSSPNPDFYAFKHARAAVSK